MVLILKPIKKIHLTFISNITTFTILLILTSINDLIMKKQLLFLLGIFFATIIMAQTNEAVGNKDGTSDTIY